MTNIPKGFRLVPEEPTPEMIEAIKEMYWYATNHFKTFSWRAGYKAMLDAAPASSCVSEAKPICYGIFDKNGEMYWSEHCIGDGPSDMDAELEVLQDDQPEREWTIRPMFVATTPAHGWMPIESAPKDKDENGTFQVILLGLPAIGALKDPTARRVYEGRWNEIQNTFTSVNGFIILSAATHWQPLPPAPRESEVG